MKTYDFGNGENVFFTSDTHFCHGKILEFCNRPFSSVDEMDKKLIENWNSVVGKNDIVFHLGDFCFGGPLKWTNVLDKLNGHIYLILGNHDMKNLKDNVRQYFTEINMQMQIQIDGWSLYLNHYPFLCFGGAYAISRNVGQAFGHVHSGPECHGLDVKRLVNLFPTQYDVGVDNNNYTPVPWSKLKKILETQRAQAIKNN